MIVKIYRPHVFMHGQQKRTHENIFVASKNIESIPPVGTTIKLQSREFTVKKVVFDLDTSEYRIYIG